MKWSDLNAFSKFLLILMGALVVIYIASQLWPGKEPALAAQSSRLKSGPPVGPNLTLSNNAGDEAKLVEALKSSRPAVRDEATSRLRQLWRDAAGPEAEQRLKAGIDMLAGGHPLAAVDHFSKIIADYPNYAEAYNQRAIAYFTVEDYERSIQDCLRTTQLNKDHFGAWNGLGRCYLAIRRYDLASSAFECALDLQPFSEENKKLIEFCKEKMKHVVPQDLNSSA